MITKIFGTPVWNYKIDIPSDLIQRIKNLMESDPTGRVYSNVGGWQSNDVGKNPAFKDVCDALQKILPDVYSDMYIGNTRKPYIGSIWINVNKGSDINLSHVHPHSHISGCFYIKCNDNSGPISFKNPSFELMQHYGLYQEVLNLELFPNKIDYKPSEGDVVLFPSWLYHEVFASSDAEERITIAFNTSLI